AGNDSIWHWDGSSWTPIPSGVDGIDIEGLSSLTQDDAWFAGWKPIGESAVPRAARWDGSAWQSAPFSPSVTDQILIDVAAIGPEDAWTVGRNLGATAAFAYRWDGAVWSEIPSGDHQAFWAVAGGSLVDVWIVGQTNAGPGLNPAVVHWNG